MSPSSTTVASQALITALQRRWVWAPNWRDLGKPNVSGKLVYFRKNFSIRSTRTSTPQKTTVHQTDSTIHISADTRYKLFVNGSRVSVGPSRGSDRLWYYDTHDLSSFLREGENTIEVIVWRCYYGVDAAAPFGRTSLPGLTVVGTIGDVCIDTDESWLCRVDEGTSFPTGIKDDIFLHIFERVSVVPESPWVPVERYTFGVKTGESSLWNLDARMIPYPVFEPIKVTTIRDCQSSVPESSWQSFLSEGKSIQLPSGKHRLELEAPYYLNAWTRWSYQGEGTLMVKYSECYESEKIDGYPSNRKKGNRRQREGQHLYGPIDSVELASSKNTYEPFWFRTFWFLTIEIDSRELTLDSFEVIKTGYPLNPVADWKSTDDESNKIWEISVRTLSNCMFDGYSDCPYFEQLQYAQDTRSSSLFHYVLSGDDRLARQALIAFQASQTPQGVLLSRYPAHQNQIISGFNLFWVIMVCDHHLYFSDPKFTKSFLPTIDRIFDFFENHRDATGLIGRLPDNHWKFIDWVVDWHGPGVERGTPPVGGKTGIYSYFSMLYAYTLKQAATLLRQMNYRQSVADEYEARANSIIPAIREHCFDGKYFTDSLASEGGQYSQHAQVWAVLSGVVNKPDEQQRILTDAFSSGSDFAPCSIVAMHYAFRAFALSNLYTRFFNQSWGLWRQMIGWEMSTWEEDPVSQRSDCHAWGSLALYEYTSEVAGLKPAAPGWKKVIWEPRPELFGKVDAKIAMGRGRVAEVSWTEEKATLRLPESLEVWSRLPGGEWTEHGSVTEISLAY